MLKLNHKNLDVWQLSITFTTKIYNLTNNFPNSETYGLSRQLRRAAVSVSSNIAEGAARKSKLERIRFFEMARSSIVEIDTQLEISTRLNYVKQDKLEDLDKEINKIFAMLSQLIKNT
jgi:four helix bundle protein